MTPTCHPDRPVKARGLCAMCYLRLWRTGSITPSEPARCFVCDVSERPGMRIERFALRTWRRPHTSVGGIFLCHRCWRNARAVPSRRGHGVGSLRTSGPDPRLSIGASVPASSPIARVA